MIRKVFFMVFITMAMTTSVKAQQSLEKEAFIQEYFDDLPEETIRQAEQMFAELGFEVKVSTYYSEEYNARCCHYETTSLDLYEAINLEQQKKDGVLEYLCGSLREDPTGESLEWFIYQFKQLNIGLCWEFTCQDKTKYVIATPHEIEEFYYKNKDLIYSALEEQ